MNRLQENLLTLWRDNVVADARSGIALGLEAPYRIGDWVDIDGSTKGLWRDNLDERSATIWMRIWCRDFGHDCDVVCRGQEEFSV